jgi:predicted nucleic acid-binding protein
MDIVLDASVVIKWFKDEDEEYVDSALSIQDRKRLGDIEIIVPDLLFLEVLNTFLTKKNFTKEDIAAIKESLIKMDMKVVYPESRLMEEIIGIAKKNKLTYYDALYIAVAGASDATLYTEDMEIVACSKDYGFIRHIRDYKPTDQ